MRKTIGKPGIRRELPLSLVYGWGIKSAELSTGPKRMNPDDFRRLVAAGLSTDQIAVVMEMMARDAAAVAAADEARKAKGRERVARWREARNVTETAQKVTVRLTRGGAPVEDKTSNLEIEPQEKKERNALSREFDLFWTEYPHKTGKPKAAQSWIKARRIASFDAVMAGLRRYIATKPADRAWLNPTTFLNQERWADEPAVVIPMSRGSPGRGIDNLINSLVTDMDDADANSTAQIERHSEAPRRISSH